MNRSIIRHLIIAALVAYPLSALGQDQAPKRLTIFLTEN